MNLKFWKKLFSKKKQKTEKKELKNFSKSDILDLEADMRVFETMIESEGYASNNEFKKRRVNNGRDKSK